MQDFWRNLLEWAMPLRLLVLALLIGLVLPQILLWIFGRLGARSSSPFFTVLRKRAGTALRVLILVLSLQVFLPLMHLEPALVDFISQVLSVILIAAVAWFLIRLIYAVEETIDQHYRIDVRDNLQARRIQTQIEILRRVIIAIVLVLAAASILMTFDKVRQLGAGIMASAGIVGIIMGIAAQKSLATLIAGIQIAITQPIRLDDVVIVENEWGRIEEITLTYVVVRIWDKRRLVVPITYFLEKPFQNWTRVSADVLGTVYLYVDHSVPIEDLRQELHRILQDSPQWDQQVWGLQVTNVTEKTVELRALMGAPDASQAWDLRCAVREKLVEYVRNHHPQALPRLRAEIQGRKAEAAEGHDRQPPQG
jgi:small-conductance mechanosensitive channel